MPFKSRSSRRGPPSQDEAEALALSFLNFLAADPQRLAGFLTATGLGPGNLRAAASEPGFLVSILAHGLSDERLLTAFAEENGVDPARIAEARERLGGESV